MYKFGFGVVLLALLPVVSAADVQKLPITADYCAIKRAMTGKHDPACPVIDAPGLTRGYSHDAAPVGESTSQQGYYIHFAFASDDLTPDYQSHLARLSDVLSSDELVNLCLKLVGHTDTVGGANYNQVLSERRARSVRLYMIGAMNFDETRVVTEGVGESQSLPNISGKDSRNRRVEILAREPEGGGCS